MALRHVMPVLSRVYSRARQEKVVEDGTLSCTNNAAHGQMGEWYLRYATGDKFELSAGIKPTGLNPLAIEVMQKIGIDISKHKFKEVISFLGQYVTVCDNPREHCPFFPGPSDASIGALPTKSPCRC